jgi:hypothetical protein
MYLPAKSFLASRIGIPIEDEETGYEIIDAIVQWFAGVFSQLGKSSPIQIHRPYSTLLIFERLVAGRGASKVG